MGYIGTIMGNLLGLLLGYNGLMGYHGIILGSSYSRFLRYMIYWESTGI